MVPHVVHGVDGVVDGVVVEALAHVRLVELVEHLRRERHVVAALHAGTRHQLEEEEGEALGEGNVRRRRRRR